jgi:hypothetical protein
MTFARDFQQFREKRAAQRAANLQALATVPAHRLHQGSYGPAKLNAAPKPETPRNPALLDLARGQPCLLLAVEGCLGQDGSTTVACHENEGKGMGIKASDARSVWGCMFCHQWYDTSGDPRSEKRSAFAAAYQRQIPEWQRIAADPSQPKRDREAAQWAISQLDKHQSST